MARQKTATKETRSKSKTSGLKRPRGASAKRKATDKRSHARTRKLTDSKRELSKRRGAKGGEASSRQSSKSALTILESDHQRMRKLLSLLESAKSGDRQSSLLQRVEGELELHTEVEEEIFYPVFRDRARNDEDRTMYYEAMEEHHAVDVILPEVKNADPGTPQFAARVKVLKELVEHHAEEEEDEMFPRARKLISPDELRELGRKIDARKQSAHSSVVDKVASFLGMD